MSFFVTGPGTPALTAFSSMRVTGSTPRVALVMKASSARRSSSGKMRVSTRRTPPWRHRSKTFERGRAHLAGRDDEHVAGQALGDRAVGAAEDRLVGPRAPPRLAQRQDVVE